LLGALDTGVGGGFAAGEGGYPTHNSCYTKRWRKALHSSCEERAEEYRINGMGWTFRETGRLYIGLLGAQDAGVGAASPPGGYPTHKSCYTKRRRKALHSWCEERAGDYRINGMGWTLRETGRLYIGWLGALDAGVGAAADHDSCYTRPF